MNRTGYALITGASGGIGAEIARLFAADGVSLILVARNETALTKLQYELSHVDVRIYVADLTKQDAAQRLHEWVHAEGLAVEYLVNNAGLGDSAPVIASEANRLEEMIALNVSALVLLSRYVGADMTKRGRGSIMNIASVAGFVPGPGMAVYFATKSFVISFSQALYAELAANNVAVTVVCPAATKTNFAKAAHAEDSAIFKHKLPSASAVALFAYRAMQNRKLVATWGWKNRVLSRVIGLAPRKAVLKAIQQVQA